MSSVYDNLTRILSATSSTEQRLAAMRGFASDLHWTPSFELHNSYGVPGAEDHLVVEHGLENAAIISFLKSPRRTGDLDIIQLRSLLTISYNNLVDWHIFVSEGEVRYINNLTQPWVERTFPLSRSSTSIASSEQFEKLTLNELSIEKAAAQRLHSCDDALIQVISRWKRLLKADYRGALNNENVSSFFNAIIFTSRLRGPKTSANKNTSATLA